MTIPLLEPGQKYERKLFSALEIFHTDPSMSFNVGFLHNCGCVRVILYECVWVFYLPRTILLPDLPSEVAGIVPHTTIGIVHR